MVELTFLGTGTSQGVPMIGCDCAVCRSEDRHDKRLRSSVAVEENGTRIVIDAGPDFRYQMLRENIRRVDGILFTHAHKDHTAGLDDVRAYNYILGKPMDIYAERRTMAVLEKDFDYAFADERYPGVPDLVRHCIGEEPFTIGAMRIVPVRGYHYKLPVLGFRIGNLCYITDMNRIPEEEMRKLEKLDVLVINALRREKHISHFTLDEALAIAERVKPRHTYLTHISHQLGRYAETNGTLPQGVEMGYDGLKITSE